MLAQYILQVDVVFPHLRRKFWVAEERVTALPTEAQMQHARGEHSNQQHDNNGEPQNYTSE